MDIERERSTQTNDNGYFCLVKVSCSNYWKIVWNSTLFSLIKTDCRIRYAWFINGHDNGHVSHKAVRDSLDKLFRFTIELLWILYCLESN